MESEKTTEAGESRSSVKVRVLTHRKLKTFLQKLSIDSVEISITDFRIIFKSLCINGSRVLSCKHLCRYYALLLDEKKIVLYCITIHMSNLIKIQGDSKKLSLNSYYQ